MKDHNALDILVEHLGELAEQWRHATQASRARAVAAASEHLGESAEAFVDAVVDASSQQALAMMSDALVRRLGAQGAAKSEESETLQVNFSTAIKPLIEAHEAQLAALGAKLERLQGRLAAGEDCQDEIDELETKAQTVADKLSSLYARQQGTTTTT